VKIAAIEKVTLDPFVSMRTGGAMPMEQFSELKKRHPAATGFVFFIGFPALTDSEIQELKNHPAKFMAITAALPGYDTLLREGILDLAIVPRTVSMDERTGEAATLRERFDQEYVILRP
jgi:hypothetical protein